MCPKRRAVVRLLQPLQHQSADAEGRLLRLDLVDLRRSARHHGRDTRGEAGSRSGESPDAPPFPVADLEDVADQADATPVAFATHGASVLVLDSPPSLLQLADAAEDTLEQIERLKTGDDDRDVVAVGDRLVLRGSPSRCRRDRPEKTLDAVVWVELQHGLHCRRHQDVRDQHG